MGFFRTLLRMEPPRPTALELAEANEMRLKNAKEAAAWERQRLIVEWLVSRAGATGIDEDTKATLFVIARLIEDGEPLKAARPKGRSHGRLNAK